MSLLDRPIVMGNWKMNPDYPEGVALLEEFKKLEVPESVRAAAVPPFVLLPKAADLFSSTRISLGAQDLSSFKNGAYTGEISGSMLSSLGAEFVLVGHSERRTYHHETNELLLEKCLRAQEASLTPVLCIGETLQEFEARKTLEVVRAQLTPVLSDSRIDVSNFVVAYEPVWAIGTGKVADEPTISKVHRELNKLVLELRKVRVPLLYGGSVKPDNASGISKIEFVDGALVGGASLSASSFGAIIQAFG